MEIYKVGGVPAHPLLVHLAVIGIPLLALIAIVLAFKPTLRARWMGPFAVVAILLGIYTIFVAGAGEALGEHVDKSATLKDHEELGEMVRNLSLAFGVLALAAWYAVRKLSGTVVTALVMLLALLGLGNTIVTILAGHEGAKAVWSDATNDSGSGGESDGDAG